MKTTESISIGKKKKEREKSFPFVYSSFRNTPFRVELYMFHLFWRWFSFKLSAICGNFLTLMQNALNYENCVTNWWAKSFSIDLIHRLLCMIKMLGGVAIYCASLTTEQSLKCNDHIKNQVVFKGLKHMILFIFEGSTLKEDRQLKYVVQCKIYWGMTIKSHMKDNSAQ